MKVTVVGLGLIGGSAALDLRARGFASSVTGAESNPDHAREALALKLVDRVAELEGAVAEADLVILAVPVGALSQILPSVLDAVGSATTVTDMGSTKEKVCAVIAGHPKRSQFVPSHPMAGTENSGPSAAKMGLFDRKIAVVCDDGSVGPAHRARVEAMYAALGMRVVTMSPAEHDLHTAYISHLSHISSFVLATTVLEKERDVGAIFDLAGGGFESTVRLAKSSPAMWNPIFEQNRENIAAALGAYIAQLQDFHGALVAGSSARTREIMEDANRIRRVLAGLGTRVERRQ
jgi:prephenate dehydrogenase